MAEESSPESTLKILLIECTATVPYYTSQLLKSKHKEGQPDLKERQAQVTTS